LPTTSTPSTNVPSTSTPLILSYEPSINSLEANNPISPTCKPSNSIVSTSESNGKKKKGDKKLEIILSCIIIPISCLIFLFFYYKKHIEQKPQGTEPQGSEEIPDRIEIII
jgi:hypothetical protein